MPAVRFLPMVESNKLPIRYPEFAARMKEAMANGQWEVQGIVDALKRAGVRITYEMVRRYTLGQAMPRPDKMGQLAGILGVSRAFFSTARTSKIRHRPSSRAEPRPISLLQTLVIHFSAYDRRNMPRWTTTQRMILRASSSYASTRRLAVLRNREESQNGPAQRTPSESCRAYHPIRRR